MGRINKSIVAYNENKEEIIRRFRKGDSISKLSKTFGVRRSALADYLHEDGIRNKIHRIEKDIPLTDKNAIRYYKLISEYDKLVNRLDEIGVDISQFKKKLKNYCEAHNLLNDTEE